MSEEEKEELEKTINDGFNHISSIICAETDTILLAMNLYMKATWGKKYQDNWDFVDKTVREYRENIYKKIFEKYEIVPQKGSERNNE